MRRGLPIRNAVSAGGVVYRHVGDQAEIVICRVHGRDVWALPKGTPEPGESNLQAAIREVTEETGLKVAAGHELGSIDYWFVQDGSRVHKVVHFWLMAPTGGSLDDHDREFDVVEWFPAETALQKLSYKGEREKVSSAMQWIAAGV